MAFRLNCIAGWRGAVCAALMGCNLSALAQSVVDPTFSSQVQHQLSNVQETYTAATAQPLWDGGVILNRVLYRGWRYEGFSHLTATGTLGGGEIFYFRYGSDVVAMLPDGTYFMRLAPYRRTDGQTPVSSFSLQLPLQEGGDTIRVKLQRDGKLLIGQGTMLGRVDEFGAIDPSFHFTGTPLSSIAQIEVDSQRRVVLVSYNGPSSTWRIERCLVGGAADASFAPIEATEPLQVTVLADDSLAVGRPGNITLATSIPNASDTHARYTHYQADGRWAEDWDLSRWSGFKVIAPDSSVYVAYQDLVYRLIGAPTFHQDPNFFARVSPNVINSLALDGSQLYVVGGFTSIDQWPTSDIGRLDVTKTAGPAAPVVRVGSGPERLRPAISFTVQAAAIGSGPLVYEWVSLDGGQLPPVTNRPALRFENFGAANVGRYQLRVTGPQGTALSSIVDLRGTEPPRLTNLSGRARVGSGDDVAIAGFVSDAPGGGRPFVLRGVGPGLAAFSVKSPLADPQLSLRDVSGAAVEENDDWDNSGMIPYWTKQAGAFNLAAGSKDAAIVRNLGTGASTLVLSSRTGDSGVALAEIYDTNTGNLPVSGELLNLSLRGHTGAGDNTLIAGFVVTDPLGLDRKLKVLIRAVGPTLASYGVTNPISDPKLTLYNAAGAPIASNDNWSESASAAEIASAADTAKTFALPVGSKDAAVLLELTPGTYTAQATPASGSDGVGLIEIYALRAYVEHERSI